MSETTERSAADLRGLLRFAQVLGLDEETVRLIYADRLVGGFRGQRWR